MKHDKTQHQLILEILGKQWTSPLAALRYAGTMKLSTRIGELKQNGYLIIDRWHETRKYKEYRLLKIRNTSNGN